MMKSAVKLFVTFKQSKGASAAAAEELRLCVLVREEIRRAKGEVL
jgi:hypothetical protein